MDTKPLSKDLRALASVEPNGSPFISCYLNLEPERDGGLAAVFEQAERTGSTLEGPARREFEEALAHIREHAGRPFKPRSRGAAFFARGGDSPFFLAMQFEVPLPTLLQTGDLPHLYPLAEIKDRFHRFVVVITNAKEARIMEVTIGEITEAIMTELPELSQRVGREWTREHYQNHRRDREDRFLKEKVRILDQLVAKGNHHHIILAGQSTSVARLKNALPPRLASKLMNTMVRPAGDGVSSVVRDAIRVFVEGEENESQANVRRLEAAVRAGGLAVAGWEASRQALERGQADLLLVLEGDRHIQAREELTRLAIRTGVLVETVGESPVLERFGGVGCLLRYRLPEPELLAAPRGA